MLEAQSMGMNSVGIDFDLKFCKMSQDNLLANDFESSIINADYKYLKEIESSFEGVVTDIPYGKNSKVKDNPEKIICDLMKVIPRRKKFAIMCKKGLEEKIDEEVNRRYDIYRHKSLTRTILVR
ncbi:MAG: hypothetical protein GWN01_12400 [Nitrosopumilaceae archaeon]|nr:hypothetical protein [Nitrosopumilaceae archaeon]NIU88090.1 hypothetical protein [Nitrosopumilaceae archaeon]NIV65110.1 hypothetical protein [Nitrosopumilaceae archaeon]NIX62278.1 hypothetical protein [Nitrosopumilaceae archaeon]